MNLFSKRFSIILEADQEEQLPTPTTDREAMEQQLDTAEASDFDPPPQASNITEKDRAAAKQIEILNGWIKKIDEFIEFLNGTNKQSVQSQLHSALCETMFVEIAQSERKKISRLAADLSALSESLKGYMISSNEN